MTTSQFTPLLSSLEMLQRLVAAEQGGLHVIDLPFCPSVKARNGRRAFEILPGCFLARSLMSGRFVRPQSPAQSGAPIPPVVAPRASSTGAQRLPDASLALFV